MRAYVDNFYINSFLVKPVQQPLLQSAYRATKVTSFPSRVTLAFDKELHNLFWHWANRVMEPTMFKHHSRIIIPHCRNQHALIMVLQEQLPCLEYAQTTGQALRVLRALSPTSTNNQPNNDWHWFKPTGHVIPFGHMVGDLLMASRANSTRWCVIIGLSPVSAEPMAIPITPFSAVGVSITCLGYLSFRPLVVPNILWIRDTKSHKCHIRVFLLEQISRL